VQDDDWDRTPLKFFKKVLSSKESVQFKKMLIFLPKLTGGLAGTSSSPGWPASSVCSTL
jgi:hypothetical protein